MVNKVILLGNVGKDPEVRSMSNGNDMASFSLATTESYKDKNSGEKKEKTEWHTIVVYNPGLVKLVSSYVLKGTKVYVEGSLHTRKWTDNNGVEKYITEVVLQDFSSKIEILNFKSNDKENPSLKKEDNSSKNNEENVQIKDEIPF